MQGTRDVHVLEDSTSPHHGGTCTTPWGAGPPVDAWALCRMENVMAALLPWVGV